MFEDILLIPSSIDCDDHAIFLQCISRRLLCPPANFHTSEDDKRRYKTKTTVSNEGNAFEGIFSRLCEETGENTVISGIVSLEDIEGRSQSSVSLFVVGG